MRARDRILKLLELSPVGLSAATISEVTGVRWRLYPILAALERADEIVGEWDWRPISRPRAMLYSFNRALPNPGVALPATWARARR